eukprot:scaffold2903_cov170-Amphora_coffeaeformis.AAC.8
MIVSFRQCSRAFSPTRVVVLRQRSGTKSSFHSTTRIGLNRFLFDPAELGSSPFTDNENGQETVTVTLPKDDYRTIHAAKILGLHNGDTVRAGVVLDNDETDHPHAGMVTDMATIQWIPEGKVKKAEPLGNGNPPGSIQITLHDLVAPPPAVPGAVVPRTTLPVSLILALPRPSQLNRMLPMICQLGVDHIVLTSAAKVPRDYFGSHLFRKDASTGQRTTLRQRLVEGLCQVGVDVRLPQITIVRNFHSFLQHDLDRFFPRDVYARVLAHPERVQQQQCTNESGSSKSSRRFDETVQFPNADRRIVVAVGPEGGWQEPEELDLLTRDFGFQTVTLGPRVLRSDVAVISLLTLAHEACRTTVTSETINTKEEENGSLSL